MNFQVGQIFNGSYPSECAVWCNENGYYIEDIGDNQYQIKEPPKPTLEELKQQKLDEVKSVSDKFRNINVNKDMWIKSSLGFEADADKDSQDNAYSLSKILETQEPGATLHYRDRANEDHELNKDQLYTLYLEMKTNGVNLFNQKWALEEKVNLAQSEEEVKAIEVIFNMMDFTPKPENLNLLF